jgi:hypothetical protein
MNNFNVEKEMNDLSNIIEKDIDGSAEVPTNKLRKAKKN